MVRKSLWIVPLLLLSAVIGSTTVRADSFDYYSISFSGPNAPTAAAGTVLTYDATTGEFTTPSFMLTQLGTTYTMDLGLPPDYDLSSDDLIYNNGNPQSAIAIADNENASLYKATTGDPNAVHGMVTLTPVAAPTPEIDPTTGTSALALLACAMLIIRGRRKISTPIA